MTISIDLAAGIFAMMIGLVLVACVITCIIAQETLKHCQSVLQDAVNCWLRADSNNYKEELHHEGTE